MQGGGDKVNMSVVLKQHPVYMYITINEIIFTKCFGAMCFISQINKVVIFPQPSNQYLYNKNLFFMKVRDENKNQPPPSVSEKHSPISLVPKNILPFPNFPDTLPANVLALCALFLKLTN